MTDVNQQVFNEWQARFGVIVLPNRFHRPELHAGLAAGFLGSHAGTDVLFGLDRHV